MSKRSDDDKEGQARALLGYLWLAVHSERGLFREEPISHIGLTGGSLSSEKVGTIIAAAQSPLVGWQSAVDPGWLKVSAPDTDIDCIRDGIRPRGKSVNTHWWCTPDGNVSKNVHDEWGNGEFFTRHMYRFESDGSLVRTATFDVFTMTYSEKDVVVPIRRQGDRAVITPDVALAAMAALLRDFGEYYLSLSRTTHAGLSKQLTEVEKLSVRLARVLENPQLKLLRPIGSEAFALVSRSLSKQVH